MEHAPSGASNSVQDPAHDGDNGLGPLIASTEPLPADRAGSPGMLVEAGDHLRDVLGAERPIRGRGRNDGNVDAAVCGPRRVCGRARRVLGGRSSVRAYYRRLEAAFGRRFVIMLVSCYFGVKGTLYTFIQGSQLPYYRSLLGVSGSNYQVRDKRADAAAIASAVRC